jgi:hypothetical protein
VDYEVVTGLNNLGQACLWDLNFKAARIPLYTPDLPHRHLLDSPLLAVRRQGILKLDSCTTQAKRSIPLRLRSLKGGDKDLDKGGARVQN